VSSLSISWQRILTKELYQSRSRYHCTTACTKSSIHMLSLHRSTSCTLMYSSSLLLACLLACFCHLLLLLRNSVHLCRCSMDTHHRKHMLCVRYPASPLALWLNLQKIRHMTSTHCCVMSPQTQRKHCSPIVCCMCVCVCVAGVAYQWIYMSQYVYLFTVYFHITVLVFK
jgi:hypothetical protein